MSLIVVVQNITGYAGPESDYTYRILVGDGGPLSKIISEGEIRGHLRADGWRPLVRRVIEESTDRG